MPMRAMPDGGSFYVFASAHGSGHNPNWNRNLVAHPDVTIEIGTAVRTAKVVGAERDAIFARHTARFPIYAEYQRRLARTIPVIGLDRRTG